MWLTKYAFWTNRPLSVIHVHFLSSRKTICTLTMTSKQFLSEQNFFRPTILNLAFECFSFLLHWLDSALSLHSPFRMWTDICIVSESSVYVAAILLLSFFESLPINTFIIIHVYYSVLLRCLLFSTSFLWPSSLQVAAVWRWQANNLFTT